MRQQVEALRNLSAEERERVAANRAEADAVAAKVVAGNTTLEQLVQTTAKRRKEVQEGEAILQVMRSGFLLRLFLNFHGLFNPLS